MDTPATNPLFVLVILGKESDAEVMQSTLDVFRDLQIPCESRLLRDLGEDEQRTAYFQDAQQRGLGAIVVATYYAYTDEPFPTALDALVPVIKVITGPAPSPEQLLTLNLPTTGFGADGAHNAGLFVARMLALGDPALRERLQAYESS